MKKFLISTFLGAVCLSFHCDTNGMDLNVERLPLLNERQRNSLKYVHLNDIHKLSQIIDKYKLKKDNYCVPSKEEIQQILDEAKSRKFDQLNDMLKKKYPQIVLIQAIKNNNYELIQRLMQTEFEQIIDVNDPDEHGVTPLMHALKNGNMEIIRYLVDKCGARFLNNDGTPLTDEKGVYIQSYARLGDHQKTSNQGVELYARICINNELRKIQRLRQDQDDQTREDYIKKLNQAIAGGDVEKVRRKVDKYHEYPINVNQADSQGVTPLMLAAQSGNIKMVALLNELGNLGYQERQLRNDNGTRQTVFDPIAQVDNNRNTLVHYAMQGGLQMIKYLWGTGYITNEDLSSPYDESGVVPLVGACRDGNVELVRFLLEDANVASNPGDETLALYLTIRSNNHTNDIVPLLLKRPGIDINGMNYAQSPLHEAISRGNVEIAKLLINAGANVNRKGEGNFGYPLIYYAIQGGVDMVKALWVDGYITNEELSSPYDESGVVPLVGACLHGNVELVRFLLEDANVESNPDDMLALYWAINSDHANEIVPLLLKRPGIDINGMNYTQSPLNKAISRGNVEIAKLLINAGADVNSKDGFRYPLIYAIERNQPAIVKLLLEQPGIQLDGITENGDTLLHLAANSGNVDIVRLIIGTGKAGDVNAAVFGGATAILAAIQKKSPEVLQLLLDTFPDININVKFMNMNKSTPLHWAAILREPKCLNLLLKRPEIEVNAQSDWGTPLTVAADEEIIKLLLEHPKIDVNTANLKGYTALHIAARFGYINRLTLLLKAGADVNITNNEIDTPILCAIRNCTTNDDKRFDQFMQVLKCFTAHYNSKGIPLPSKAKVQSRLDKRSRKTWCDDYLSDEQKQQVLNLFPAK